MTINIRQVVRSGVQSLNPDIGIVIVRQQGYAVDAGGRQVPILLPPAGAQAQIQPVSTQDLKHINDYNTASQYYTLYIDGVWSSLNRPGVLGGDLIYFYGSEWLTVTRAEIYRIDHPWTKVSVVEQRIADAPEAP